MLIHENTLLAPYTYYKIGGPARYFAQPKNIDDLKTLAQFISQKKVPFFLLGAGSNVLFADEGFNGLVIQTSQVDRTFLQTSNTLELGASIKVIEALRYCMTQGVAGLEMLVGIPGSMGGVFFMNAGTKIGEIKDVISQITTFDFASGELNQYTTDQIKYSYRKQNFLNETEIILKGLVQTRASQPTEVQNVIQSLLLARKQSQPIDKPSCGSVFKNPNPKNGIHAWQLIDQVGLRGYRRGQAQISELHTNFILNLGGATAADVFWLITEAKKRVLDKLGVTLEEEVKII